MTPKKWRNQKIKRLFNVKNGGTPKSSEPDYWEPEEVVWVTPEDLSKGNSYIHDSIRKISYKGLENSSANIIKSGSIVLSTRAPIGNIKIVQTPYATNQGCKSLEQNDKTDIRFFYYYLSINKDYLNQLGRGTTFLELSNEALKNVELAVPKLQEQKNISYFLDKKTSQIDSLISDKERLIELLEEKRQAVITETVTKGLDPNVKMKDSGIEWIGEIPEHWEIKKLKYLAKIIDGDRGSEYPNEKDLMDEGIPFLSSDNLKEYELNLEKTRFISLEKFTKLGKGKLINGDIIVSVRGTIGKTGLFETDKYVTGFINAQMMIIRPSCRLSDNFLYYFTKSNIWNITMDYHAYGTAQQQLSNKVLSGLPLITPPIFEQKAINDYLITKNKTYDNGICNIKQQISKLKEYRESLIYEAVTGKIDVRDYVTETEEVY